MSRVFGSSSTLKRLFVPDPAVSRRASVAMGDRGPMVTLAAVLDSPSSSKGDLSLADLGPGSPTGGTSSSGGSSPIAISPAQASPVSSIAPEVEGAKPRPTPTTAVGPEPTRTTPSSTARLEPPMSLPLSQPSPTAPTPDSRKTLGVSATSQPARTTFAVSDDDGTFLRPQMPTFGGSEPALASRSATTGAFVADGQQERPAATRRATSARQRLGSIFGSTGILSMLSITTPNYDPEAAAAPQEDTLDQSARSGGAVSDKVKKAFRSMTSSSGSSGHSPRPPRWTKKMVTERLHYDLSPHYQKNVRLEFVLGDVQTLRFVVAETADTYAQDAEGDETGPAPGKGPLGDDKVIGWVDINLSDLCFNRMWESPSHELNLSLPPDMPGLTLSPSVTIHLKAAAAAGAARQSTPCLVTRSSSIIEQYPKDAMVTMFCRAENLDDMDIWGQADPYFVVSKAITSGIVDMNTDTAKHWKPVYKSEVIFSSNDPEWAGFTVGLEQLCGGQYNKQLKVEVWDHDKVSHHDLVGIAYVSLADIYGTAATRELINPRKKLMYGLGRYSNSGVFVFESVQLSGIERTFTSFMVQGTQLGLCFAVDFGLSNGHPADPTSRHFHHPRRNIKDPETLNVYEKIMIAVGRSMQSYDDSNIVVGYGFGARIPDLNNELTLSNLFNMNGDAENPLCAGTYGLMNAYSLARDSVAFWGPVRLAPVLERVREWVRWLPCEIVRVNRLAAQRIDGDRIVLPQARRA
ncbi:Copine-domain-containing protein [Hyaloraphidium curvatum]|nr:Copine-domain-containing protein [Hyaloraphidium curvatum]